MGISRPQGTKPDMGAYEFSPQAPVVVVTALAEPVILEGVTVYPNPAENGVTIRWKPVAGVQGRVEVLNCLGQTVAQHPLRAAIEQIDIQPLTTGLYLLLIYRDDKLIHSTKLLRN